MLGLQQIFGRDQTFYNLLEASADEAKNSASLLVRLLGAIGTAGTDEAMRDVTQSRRKHKRITLEITQQLCRNFVTPLEREDIEALSNSLYKIPKSVEKIAEHLLYCPENIPVQQFARQIALLEQAAAIVVIMVRALRRQPHVEAISDEYERLQAVEGEADDIMGGVLRELYRGRASAKEMLILKDLYEMLEKVIDRCRDAGNVVFQVVLKYS